MIIKAYLSDIMFPATKFFTGAFRETLYEMMSTWKLAFIIGGTVFTLRVLGLSLFYASQQALSPFSRLFNLDGVYLVVFFFMMGIGFVIRIVASRIHPPKRMILIDILRATIDIIVLWGVFSILLVGGLSLRAVIGLQNEVLAETVMISTTAIVIVLWAGYMIRVMMGRDDRERSFVQRLSIILRMMNDYFSGSASDSLDRISGIASKDHEEKTTPESEQSESPDTPTG